MIWPLAEAPRPDAKSITEIIDFIILEVNLVNTVIASLYFRPLQKNSMAARRQLLYDLLGTNRGAARWGKVGNVGAVAAWLTGSVHPEHSGHMLALFLFPLALLPGETRYMSYTINHYLVLRRTATAL